ncbi:Putative oxidoreductase SadH [Mycobacterium basiliense]|uniref:Oxidoreductase SadH n=1 Tax=Mycobacterium basiliense TaxID=2094119 RepID=A0A447GFW8_9MYCO|nr:SDR family oxidoreductase [Mycobacterium basiliense]VDM89391.1 Putative oxidoreductase SadH [Mycobacterium basiliense]
MPATKQAPQRFVDSSGDVRIAVYAEGNPDGPTVVLVHGFPDSHVLWDGVVPLLAKRFRVIRYDNRGVGLSSAPKPVSAYTMARFADDFAAVIDQLSPGRPVHVLGHDWGSVAIWEYLTRPGAADRVASFTSVSGPSQDQLTNYIFGGLRRPWRPRTFVRALSQALRLSYMALFSVPVLTPLVLRVTLSRASVRRNMVDNIPVDQIHHSENLASDAANSVKTYPANYFRSFSRERRKRGVPVIDVPVQLVVNTDDPYVRPYGYEETERWVPRLWRRDIKAGHFSPMSHPQVMAAAVHDFADLVDGKQPSRALLRAQVGRPRKYFGDTLVSVTGAGSGIGRETALAFAREGAEVVLSDVDEATVKDTAGEIAAHGGVAHVYVLDVSDATAVEAFAEQISAEHGVPDIVVNNAGIGQAGRFLDTPAEQFDRVLDVNLGGVVNGCRSFGRRLVERGTGGHIVNVSSMAAYAPLQSLSAYCTSKAATYMFSDCLRAELDAAGVGLTTICPGVINTNIVNTTRFDAPSGKGDEHVDDRRGQLDKMFALRRYGPDKVANAIVSAVKKGKPIRPVAPEAYALYGVSRVLPQALRSTARMRVI